jgi:hypothetical protein
MSESGILSLFGICLGVIVTSSGAIWYKLGQLQKAVKTACPFGGCPLFKGTLEDTVNMVEQMRKQGIWTQEQMNKGSNG